MARFTKPTWDTRATYRLARAFQTRVWAFELKHVLPKRLLMQDVQFDVPEHSIQLRGTNSSENVLHFDKFHEQESRNYFPFAGTLHVK